MQRAAELSLLPFAIELVRKRRRFRIDFDDGTKRRSLSIEAVDAAQVRVHDRAGGEAAGPHSSLQIRDRQFVELEGWWRRRGRRGWFLSRAGRATGGRDAGQDARPEEIATMHGR